MSHVKIATADLLQIRGELVKVAALEKRAAELERANEIYRQTMDLVAEGNLDPGVAIEKVAEFQEDPIRLEIFKAALDHGSADVTKLGTAVDDTNEVPSGAGTPEGKLGYRVASIVDGHDLANL